MENKNDDVKLRKKTIINTLRHGKRNIREMLRERCHEEIRKKRQELFNAKRLGLSDEEKNLNNSFAEILRKEFSDLSMIACSQTKRNSQESNSILISENGTTDIEDEVEREYQCMLKAYDEMQQFDGDCINEFIAEIFKNEVICPICQMASIEELAEGLVCQGCKINLPPKLSIRQLAINIEEKLKNHNKNCLEQASFAILPENDSISLYLICDACANFALIM